MKTINTIAKKQCSKTYRLLRIIKNAIILLTIAPVTVFSQNGNGDPPPPPPEERGQNGNQPPGGGAPIGSGVAILLALGAAYGGKKVYDYRKRKLLFHFV